MHWELGVIEVLLFAFRYLWPRKGRFRVHLRFKLGLKLSSRGVERARRLGDIGEQKSRKEWIYFWSPQEGRGERYCIIGVRLEIRQNRAG